MSEEKPSRFSVGLVQMACRGTREENLGLACEAVSEAAGRGASLVCLQELFSGPYFCQKEDPAAFDLAESLDGPTVSTLREAAKRCGVTVSIPFFERRAAGLFHNSSVIAGPDGQLMGHYRKMHIPDDPQFMEKYYFTPGDLGFSVVQSSDARLGSLICWDQWFPEAARLTAMMGAEVLLYPTAIGWLPSEKSTEGQAQLDAWRTILRSHAIANGVFVVATNRVGIEGPKESGIEFWGHSMVIDPLGRVVAEAGEEGEVLVTEVDLGVIGETRKWWPFFRDRRIEEYGGLTRRYLEEPGR